MAWLLAWAFTVHVRAQQNPLFTTLDEAERDISAQLFKSAPSQLVNQTTMRDRQVLDKAAPSLLGILRDAGHSTDAAAKGVAYTWFSLRVGKEALPLTTPLSMNAVQVRAANLGKVIVTSEPTEAAIFVDDVSRDDDTNAEVFAVVGKRFVRVQRTGLQPATATCNVTRNGTSTFSATLAVSGSKAECK